MAKPYDVIVIGLGGMGSAVLAHLADRGCRVLGLEQFHPAHARGSSHGDSRIIRQAYYEDPAYVPLLLRAYELWADLAHRTGNSLFLQTGGLMLGYAGSDLVEGSTRSAREHGLPHEVMSPPEIRRRFPAMRPHDDEIALYEPNAGILFPEQCILSHLQMAVTAGAEARFGVQVLGWSTTSEGGVQVQTSQGEVSAERLVICAGAWFNALAPELGLPLKVERNVMHWFKPAANTSDFGPGSLPIYLLQRRGTPFMYGFPSLPGQGIKAAFHHSERYTTVAEIDRRVDPAEAEQVRQALAGLLPDAAGPIQKSVVCMYTNTPDENFVIGPHPEHPQVVVAGGFSGHGFKFCSVVGELIADLTTEGTSRLPMELFTPLRFTRQ
jgi:sarcosine oxidase